VTSRKGSDASLPSIPAQRFRNAEIHNWYRFMWGYSDHLVADLLNEWKLRPGARVLDPFCGTGTTLVECLKRGFSATGVDASPASVFASRVKTRWNVRSLELFRAIEEVLRRERRMPTALSAYMNDPTYVYLDESGMLGRKWINGRPLRRALAIKRSIAELQTSKPYQDLLTLALLDTVVQVASNVRFGPELFVGFDRYDAPVLDAFVSRALVMACDLALVQGARRKARVVQGDSREIASVLHCQDTDKFRALICSPPYPTEHDYTRNGRLELAFLEEVSDKSSVRSIKQSMIRSHTKGIYASDTDWDLVWTHPALNRVVRSIDSKVNGRSHGFARLYSTVIASYFGGMYRHLKSAKKVLKPGAQCAYVVSDQASYANVRIPTARILQDIAAEIGFEVTGVRHWRSRQSSKTSRVINEEILLLRNSRRK
jgi:SAM-dependent methyltransferase